MSNTFCILPWIHAQTKPNGQIKPCCRFDHKHKDYLLPDKTHKFDKFNINDITFNDALNSVEWQEIRNTMLKGEKVIGCRKCYQEEEFDFTQEKNAKRKIKSMRNKENWMWNNDNQIEPVDTSSPKLKYIELALGTYCNLKCRTCTADLSSAWIEDESILSSVYKDRRSYDAVVNVSKDWDIDDFEFVEEIKFTGGEPMLHPNFIKTIDTLIATNRQHLITLDIFTNASWIPRDKVLDRLKQFKQVTINLSIDGVGYVNDYIRFPSEWNVVNDSAREWLETEKNNPDIFIVKWAPVISIFNVWLFHRMTEWWFGLQKEIKNVEWWNSLTAIDENDSPFSTIIVNVVHDPKYLSPALYPNKKLLIHKLLAHRDMWVTNMNEDTSIDPAKRWNSELQLFAMYSKVLGALSGDLIEEDLKMFVEYTADLDKIRNQDIRISLPDLWKRIDGLIEYKGRIND